MFRHWLARELQDWLHTPPVVYYCVALTFHASSGTERDCSHGVPKGMGISKSWMPLALEEDEVPVEGDVSNTQPKRARQWKWGRRGHERGTRGIEEKRFILSAVIRMPMDETKNYVPSAHDDGLFVGTMRFSS
ncbi:SubName: Full=Uncharacterized protein {ECO:0000313/EMBL:CCA73257.1} [Serendipita indica DSM 11827]|nr:SubName: Full=Uncharacterized protein {ECO:0000313/EMBL:CCA73257.1} [Serendipita indica DSM 11827]